VRKYKVVSLFCGAGGMDYGFHIDPNFEIVWANDFDADACETYKNNIDKNVVCADITKIDKTTIPDCDIVIGGFPCQGFSVANTKRNMQDKRNFLYRELLETVRIKKPKVFVAENVKGLLSMENGKIIEMIVADFTNLGYKVDYKVVVACDYGVPQNRERILIIGNNINAKNIFPSATTTPNNYITVEDAIGFLADIPLSSKPIKLGDNIIYNHIAYTNVSNKYIGRKHKVNQADICDYLKYWRDKAKQTTKKIDDIFGYKYTAGHWFRKDNNSGSIPKVDDWFRLKEILKFDNKYDIYVTELEEREIIFEQSLRITNWDKPSDTITATAPEIHINKQRRLSCRECAILQSFPLDFIFYGSINSIYRQIGNAVPVKLGNAVAICVKNILKENK
jgi:DNA (cytosine-5)-methyltransferase 1